IALYEPQRHAAYTSLYFHDPLVLGRCVTARARWGLGYPDQAQESIHAALALAEELAHPMSLAFALFFAAFVHWLRRDGARTRELSRGWVALAPEQELPHFRAFATVWHGWALAEEGLTARGVAQIRHGAAALRATGTALFRTVIPTLLGESLAQQGHTEEGLA